MTIMQIIHSIVTKYIFMNEEEYYQTLERYGARFELQWSWRVSITDNLPDVKLNCDSNKAIAWTDYVTRKVEFKSILFKKPKILIRAYIRHELRHCQQMEKMHDEFMKKGLDDSLANVYTMMIINNDNLNGYSRSIMEADAWLAFIGIYLNINKVVGKLIKRNLGFLL